MTEEKKWPKVASDIGYSTSNKNIPSLLKAHYERILYPLDVFEREEKKKAAARDSIKKEQDNGVADEVKEEAEEKEYKPHNIPSRMKGPVPVEKDKAGRRSKRYGGGGEAASTPTKDTPTKKEGKTEEGDSGKNGSSSAASSFSKELARLQFFGAGPKMAGLPPEKGAKDKGRSLKMNLEYDPVSMTSWCILTRLSHVTHCLLIHSWRNTCVKTAARGIPRTRCCSATAATTPTTRSA